jgi:hypothetical protein
LIVTFFSSDPRADVPVAVVVILAIVGSAIALAVSSVELPAIALRLPWRRKRKVIRYELRRKRIEPPSAPVSEAERYARSTWVPAGQHAGDSS